MSNSIFCTMYLLLQIINRRHILENISGIDAGLMKIRKGSDWCISCKKCKLIWYLTSAIKLGDPYKIVEINDLLIGLGLNFESSPDAMGYIKESKAWIGIDSGLDDNIYEKNGAAYQIHRWKLRELTASDLDALKATNAHLHWMLEIVRASVHEANGNYETAVQDYRRALKIMPRWIPEAKIAFEKINELAH